MVPPEREDGPRWATGGSKVDTEIAWTAGDEPFHFLLRGDAVMRVAAASLAALVVVGAVAVIVGPALLQPGSGSPDQQGAGGSTPDAAASDATTPTPTSSPSPTAPRTPTATPSPTPTSDGFGGFDRSDGGSTSTAGGFTPGTETATGGGNGTQTQGQTLTESPTPTDECEGICIDTAGVGTAVFPWTVLLGAAFLIRRRRRD